MNIHAVVRLDLQRADGKIVVGSRIAGRNRAAPSLRGRRMQMRPVLTGTLSNQKGTSLFGLRDSPAEKARSSAEMTSPVSSGQLPRPRFTESPRDDVRLPTYPLVSHRAQTRGGRRNETTSTAVARVRRGAAS